MYMHEKVNHIMQDINTASPNIHMRNMWIIYSW
jgi:hypothetical protein